MTTTWQHQTGIKAQIVQYFRDYKTATRKQASTDIGCTLEDIRIALGGKPRTHNSQLSRAEIRENAAKIHGVTEYWKAPVTVNTAPFSPDCVAPTCASRVRIPKAQGGDGLCPLCERFTRFEYRDTYAKSQDNERNVCPR